MRLAPALLVAFAVAGTFAAPARAGTAFDYDALGEEFCRLTLAGDLAHLRPLLSRQLAAALDQAARNPALPPAEVLFQTYLTPVPRCTNAALGRGAAGEEGRAPAGSGWARAPVVARPGPRGSPVSRGWRGPGGGS